MINHVNEVTTRGGQALALAAEHPALRSNIHNYLVVPDSDRVLTLILAVAGFPSMLYNLHDEKPPSVFSKRSIMAQPRIVEGRDL
jgi:hypothetical protein